LNPHVPKDTGT